MKSVSFISLALAFALLFSACKKDEHLFETQNVSFSECKAGQRFAEESVHLKMLSDNILKLTHINSIFNCCPEELSSSASLENNVIYIKEKESGDLMCDCLCYYDMSIELKGLEQQNYTFRIEKHDELYYEFKLNITAHLDTVIPIPSSI